MTMRHKMPTDAEVQRVNDVADAIADLLAVQPQSIRTDITDSLRISLTVAQAERLVKMAQASTIIG